MEILDVKFKVYWQVKFNPIYKVTKCKKIINSNRCTLVNQTIKGGAVGWWIGKDFIKRKEINDYLEKIKPNKIPF